MSNQPPTPAPPTPAQTATVPKSLFTRFFAAIWMRLMFRKTRTFVANHHDAILTLFSTAMAAVSAYCAYKATQINVDQLSVASTQIVQNNNVARAQLYAQSLQAALEADKALQDKSLSAFFFQDENIEYAGNDKEAFARACSVVIDVFDMVLFLHTIKDSDGIAIFPGQEGWHNWMLSTTVKSSALRRVFWENLDVYVDNKELIELFEEAEAEALVEARNKYDKSAPKKPLVALDSFRTAVTFSERNREIKAEVIERLKNRTRHSWETELGRLRKDLDVLSSAQPSNQNNK